MDFKAVDMNKVLLNLAVKERDIAKQTLSASVESFAMLTDAYMRLAKVNRDQAAIIDDQRKQIEELTAYINKKIEARGE